jgi:hypothetical protein
MWLPGSPLARTLVTPFALVASPKLGLRQVSPRDLGARHAHMYIKVIPDF